MSAHTDNGEIRQGQTFTCPECGLRYADEETARRCEAWCRKHKSCNLEIIKHAINETSE